MKFGTDGIRGPAGMSPIDGGSAARVGYAAAMLARANGAEAVVVARDTRVSGEELASRCLAGIAAAGIRAVDAGILPTAGLAVALDRGQGGAGVMITASHNPWQDNGFKILSQGGRKPTSAETDQLESWLQEELPSGGDPPEDHGEAMLAQWTGTLDRALPAIGQLVQRRIALDLAAGAAVVARPWLDSLGIDWVFVHGGRINEGIGSEHPEALAAAVREQGCEAGIAVDGDADRCVLVDELGAVVPGDALAWLLATALEVKQLAVTVMSNGALAPALPGVSLTVTPVGDKHLQIAMREHGISLGCEESGHVLFADHPGGDGLLAGMRALCHALPRGALSSVLAGYQPWPRVKSKIRVGARPALETVAPIQEACANGRRRLGEGGRVFLRYSGTEPVLRILVEGRVDAVVRAVAEDVERVASDVLG